MTERSEVIYSDLAKMGSHPFTYDRGTQKFIVGDESFWLVPDVMDRMHQATKDLPNLTAEEVKSHPLVHGNVTGDTYGLPKLLEFYTNKLDDESRYEVQRDVEETMTEAIKSLDPMSAVVSTSFFDARLVPGQPLVLRGGKGSLRASSDHATLPAGIHQYEASYSGDFPEGKVAFYCGLGRLAALANELG